MENKKYCYEYPHPAVTADCVVFGVEDGKLHILLIERGGEPYKGCWAIPGGFMNIDESADLAAIRELKEETDLDVSNVRQVGAYTTVDRDPRERIVDIAYYTVIQKTEARGCDDAAQAKWFPIDELPTLAFDHAEILRDAKQKLSDDLAKGLVTLP